MKPISRLTFMMSAASLLACSSTSMTYQGVYTWGAEVETFSPCGAGKTFWVLTSSENSRRLSAAHQSLTTMPYEGIFARVSGYYDGPATEETGGAFSTQYDGLFRITEIRSMEKLNSLDCMTMRNPPR